MNNYSWSKKLILGLLVGLVCGETFRRVGDKFFEAIIPPPVLIVLAILILAGSVAGVFFWRSRRLAFWVGALRYGIAFDLVLFGLQKIYHQQFNVPLGMLDEPFSSISKRWLMWAYFGRSREFVVTIAAVQIVGSLLLVFNRTRLLGVIVLIPVMLNIILLDYFYDLEPGVLIHAIFLFAGLIQLFLLDYDRLVEFFLKDKSIDPLSVRTSNAPLKWIGRLSVIALPLLLLVTYDSPGKHPELKGKYRVTRLEVNGKQTTPMNDADSVLTVVYFEMSNDCVFEFNSLKRRMFGTYELNDDGSLATNWHFPPSAHTKSFNGILERNKNDRIQLNGLINGDTVKASLERVAIFKDL